MSAIAGAPIRLMAPASPAPSASTSNKRRSDGIESVLRAGSAIPERRKTLYKTASTLPEQIRSRSVALLNRHLAAAAVRPWLVVILGAVAATATRTLTG